MNYKSAHIINVDPTGLLKAFGIVMLFLFAGCATVCSQTAAPKEYQIKAVFLYNFTHFINWPEEAFENQYAPFIIGIVGKDPFGPALADAIADERIGSHLIRIKRFNSIKEIEKCHILYIGTPDPDEIKSILSAVAKQNILTVSDSPNFIRWGGMIRFYTDQNKIRLQINNTLAKAAGLKISSKLLRVSQVL